MSKVTTTQEAADMDEVVVGGEATSTAGGIIDPVGEASTTGCSTMDESRRLIGEFRRRHGVRLPTNSRA